MIRFWQGRVAACEENFGRAIEYAGRAGDHRQEAEALRWLALATAEGPAPAADGIRRLRSILEEAAGDHRVEISRRAVPRRARGDDGQTGRGESAHRARQGPGAASSAITWRWPARSATRASSRCSPATLAAAEAELRAGYEPSNASATSAISSSLAPDLGDAIYEQGRYDEALRAAEFAEGITIEGDVDAEVGWRQLRAKALARRGRLEEAEALALEAVQLAAATDYIELHALALMSLAEVLGLAGRKPEAAAAVREALDLYRRKGNVVGEARVAALLDVLGS